MRERFHLPFQRLAAPNAWKLLDARLVVVCFHGLGNDQALRLGERAGDDVGHHSVGPLLLLITNGIPKLEARVVEERLVDDDVTLEERLCKPVSGFL